MKLTKENLSKLFGVYKPVVGNKFISPFLVNVEHILISEKIKNDSEEGFGGNSIDFQVVIEKFRKFRSDLIEFIADKTSEPSDFLDVGLILVLWRTVAEIVANHENCMWAPCRTLFDLIISGTKKLDDTSKHTIFQVIKESWSKEFRFDKIEGINDLKRTQLIKKSLMVLKENYGPQLNEAENVLAEFDKNMQRLNSLTEELKNISKKALILSLMLLLA